MRQQIVGSTRCGLSFLLALSLFACTAPSPTPLLPSVNRPQPVQQQNKPDLKSASARLMRTQTGALRFEIDYPLPAIASGAFKTQALSYSQFARFQVSIIGIGIASPLYPAAANAQQNNSLPAQCNANTCSLQTAIENVPSGENRVALITAYNAAGQPIPESTLAAAFTVPADPAESVTVRLSYLSTPVGQIIQSLLAEQAHLLVSQLDPQALQNLIIQLTGATGNFPDFTFVKPPALLNLPALVADIKANQGNLSALNNMGPTNLAYFKPGALITGSISGLVGNDKVKLRLTDPASKPLILGNGGFSFENVPAGDWQLVLENTQGYQVTNSPGNVSLTESQQFSLPQIQLTQNSAAPPVLIQTVIQQGGQITLQGRNFDALAVNNTITITGNLFTVGGPIYGFWTVDATDITEEGGLQSVSFPLPPEITGQWVNLKIGDPNQPIGFTISPFQVIHLSQGAALGGDTILLNGTKFDPIASNHEIVIAGRTIPTANITVLNENQMQVLLPTDLPPGETIVEVSKSGVESAFKPPLTILSQTKAWSAAWGVIPATAAEHVVAVASSSLLPNRVWFGSKVGGAGSGGIWVCDFGTSDSCANVKPGDTVGSIQAFAQAPNSTYRVYAGSQSLGFWLCEANCDQSANWKAHNYGLGNLNIRAIQVDPQEPNKIYLATAAGVYRSQNSGATWSAYNTGLSVAQQNVHSLSIYRPTILAEPVLYIGTDGAGVMRKIGNADWASINTGIFSQDASSNEGSAYLQNVTISALEAHPSDPSLLYGGGTGQYQLAIAIWKVGIWQRSETGGLSNWQQIGNNGSNGFPCPDNTFGTCLPLTPGTGLSSMQVLDLAIDPAQPQHIYAATRLDGAQTGGVYRSTDAGLSWQAFNQTQNAGVSLDNATVLAINHLRLYAGTPQGLYRAP